MVNPAFYRFVYSENKKHEEKWKIFFEIEKKKPEKRGEVRTISENFNTFFQALKYIKSTSE